MLLAFGGLLMALGLVSGGVLMAAALGWPGAEPGWTAALSYPFLTGIGMGLVASSQDDSALIGLIRWTGRLSVLVGMVCAVALVLGGIGLIPFPTGWGWLIWLLVCGSSIGAAGEMAARRPKPA